MISLCIFPMAMSMTFVIFLQIPANLVIEFIIIKQGPAFNLAFFFFWLIFFKSIELETGVLWIMYKKRGIHKRKLYAKANFFLCIELFLLSIRLNFLILRKSDRRSWALAIIPYLRSSPAYLPEHAGLPWRGIRTHGRRSPAPVRIPCCRPPHPAR